MTEKTAAELAAEVRADFTVRFDQVKAIAEDAIGKARAGEDMTKSVKEVVDETLTGLNETRARLDELEQKAVRLAGAGKEGQKTFGEQFVESDAFKEFQGSGFGSRKSASMNFKATLTTATSAAAGSVGDAIFPKIMPEVMAMPQRRLTVRDLLTQGRTDAPSVEYVKETGFTNSAAPTAEGAAKPQSDLQFEIYTTSTKVIAHWMKASRQVLSDVSQLQSIINQRLLYGLAYIEEGQLLNGDGTGQNLNGIVTQATAYSAPITVSGDNGAIDQIRLMMLQAALAEYPASGIVMHPSDWARIELAKDGNGQYLIGNPQGTTQPTLWALPVVATQAMTVDKALVGAFKLGAQVFDQWDARVETGYVNDDFTKNLVTILAEERLALAVYRPEAFIYGDLGYQ